ncbi:MAG: tRNA lysidine(34) synthetase TilS [Candidatus Neomarinimicrobiota bacterium]
MLLAVSGGLDSIALLDLFANLRDAWQFKLVAAHVNHHLRPAADRDAELVQQYCRRQTVECRVIDLNPDDRQPGDSREIWARDRRYLALRHLAEEIAADWIVTAHQLNDQAETILMHLADGCGIAGLRGIPAVRGNIIRPLLDFSRDELRHYVRDRQLQWTEDETNLDTAIPRNFIRNEILSTWLKRTPHLLKALQMVARYAWQQDELVQYLVQQSLPAVVRDRDERSIRLDGTALDGLPVALRTALIRSLCGDTGQPWRRHWYESLEYFLNHADTGQFAELPNGWIILKDRANVILRLGDRPGKLVIEISPGATIEIGDYRFNWRPVEMVNRFTGNPWSEYIDAGVLRGKTLILRTWRPGDRFQPLGLTGEKKVSDLLIDLKVDRFQKQRQLVLTADDEVVWVCGRRLADSVKITPASGQIAELSLEQKVGL